MDSESDGWHLGLENPRRASAGPVFVQHWRLRGTSGLKTLAAPQPAQSSSSHGATVASQAQDSSYMASESDGWHLGLENPRRASPAQSSSVMAPPWPAKPRTAVIWLPKATDGTSGLKTLAAPQPAQSSSSNGATVASQAQDSSYMDSESDGLHLGLENPRRASAGPVFVQHWRLRGRPSRGQQLSGFRKRRMAPQARKPLPRLSRPSLRLAIMVPQWPARPRTAVIWIPKATDGTSALKTLAAPASQAQDSSYMASESDGWHLRLENPRRAAAGPVFV